MTTSARRLSPLLGLAMVAATGARAADEISGADKLRALYSAEFRFTQDGLPVVPVAIAEGLSAATSSPAPGATLRLLPEGQGGPREGARRAPPCLRAGDALRRCRRGPGSRGGPGRGGPRRHGRGGRAGGRRSRAQGPAGGGRSLYRARRSAARTARGGGAALG